MKYVKWIVLLAAAGCFEDVMTPPVSDGGGGGGGEDGDSGPETMGDAAQPPTGAYHVSGNTIYDPNGHPHVFRGLARPSLECNPAGEFLSQGDYQLMASWQANVVRLSLNQDFWLSGASSYAPNYQNRVDQQVRWAEQAGLDVILDLHWSDRGDLHNASPGQQRMADANSVTFWGQVAAHYGNDPRVLFELYNEPHDVSWDVWLSGGPSGDGFTAVGMQQLYDTVRASAQNLVIIGGLDFAYNLSGVPTHRINGHDIVYNTHPYNQPNKMPGNSDGHFGFSSTTDPFIPTQFCTFHL